MIDMRALYQEVILEHNKKPRNYGELKLATHQAHGFNPLCGDDYTVYVIVKDGIIENISFQGSGCAISKASASMMTSRVKGQPIAQAEELIEAFREMMQSENEGSALEFSEQTERTMRHLKVFEGVAKLPSRIKCAVLPWHALSGALNGDEDASTEGDSDEWENKE